MAISKPQHPMSNQNGYFYPITTADQIILSDGSRLEKNGILAGIIGGGGGVSEGVQTQINELSASIDALREEILGGAW